MGRIKIDEKPLYEEDELTIYDAEKYNSKTKYTVYRYKHLGDIKTYENKVNLLKIMYKNKVKLCKIMHSERDETYFYIITEKVDTTNLDDVIRKREDMTKIMAEIGSQIHIIHNTLKLENKEIEKIKSRIKNKLIDVKQNIINKETSKLLKLNKKINFIIDYTLEYFDSNESSKYINVTYNGLDDENYIMFNKKNQINTMIGNLNISIGFVGKDLIQLKEIIDNKYWTILWESYTKNLELEELQQLIKIGEVLKIVDKIKHAEIKNRVEDIEDIKIFVNKSYYKIVNKKYSTAKVNREDIIQDNLDWIKELTLGEEIKYYNEKTKLNTAYLPNNDDEFVYKVKEISEICKIGNVDENIKKQIKLVHKALDNGAKIYETLKITKSNGVMHSLTKKCYGEKFNELLRANKNIEKLTVDIVNNTYIINTCEKNISEEDIKKEIERINSVISEIRFFLIDLNIDNPDDCNYKYIENMYKYIKYVYKNVDISKYMGVIFGDLINTGNILAVEEKGEYRLENFIDTEFMRIGLITFDISLFVFTNFLEDKEIRDSIIKLYVENFHRKYRGDITKLIYFNAALTTLSNIIYDYREDRDKEEKMGNLDVIKALNESIINIIGSELDNLKLKNVEYESGRICDETGVTSVIISNKYRDRLVENIEIGVREACILLLDMGYELMTSCQGHSPEECEFNTRIIGFCVEEDEVKNIKEKIDNINRKNSTTINTSLNKMKEDKLGKLLLKDYNKPIRFNIIFGDYDKCENNYSIFLKEFK